MAQIAKLAPSANVWDLQRAHRSLGLRRALPRSRAFAIADRSGVRACGFGSDLRMTKPET
eukprot:1902332-Pleurochrysis_carterae.AAC.2